MTSVKSTSPYDHYPTSGNFLQYVDMTNDYRARGDMHEFGSHPRSNHVESFPLPGVKNTNKSSSKRKKTAEAASNRGRVTKAKQRRQSRSKSAKKKRTISLSHRWSFSGMAKPQVEVIRRPPSLDSIAESVDDEKEHRKEKSRSKRKKKSPSEAKKHSESDPYDRYHSYCSTMSALS